MTKNVAFMGIVGGQWTSRLLYPLRIKKVADTGVGKRI